MIKCFERSTVERIEENSNDVSRCFIFLYRRNTHNTAIAKEEHKTGQKRHCTMMTVPALLISPWKRKGKKREREKKKILQQGVFVFGHPSKYCLRRTGLNFVEQTKSVAVLVVY